MVPVVVKYYKLVIIGNLNFYFFQFLPNVLFKGLYKLPVTPENYF